MVLSDAYRIKKVLEVGRRPIYECFAGFDIDYVIDFRISRCASGGGSFDQSESRGLVVMQHWHARTSPLRRCSSAGSTECVLTHI